MDLLLKAQGVEQAEQYFNSLPDDVNKLQVYSALLNCYAATKSVEKAEATAKKMKQSPPSTRPWILIFVFKCEIMGNLLCLVQVDRSTDAIKENFRKFDDVLEPGCIACRGYLKVGLLDILLLGFSSWMSSVRPKQRYT
ncbi:putative tetratricopeptide-like helical domain superfamily [Helianthus anomalus]